MWPPRRRRRWQGCGGARLPSLTSRNAGGSTTSTTRLHDNIHNMTQSAASTSPPLMTFGCNPMCVPRESRALVCVSLLFSSPVPLFLFRPIHSVSHVVKSQCLAPQKQTTTLELLRAKHFLNGCPPSQIVNPIPTSTALTAIPQPLPWSSALPYQLGWDD